MPDELRRSVQRLEIDPDLGARAAAPLALWMQLALVGAGGAAGALVRGLLEAAAPPGSAFPWTTLAINVVGSGLLALLLGLVWSRPPHVQVERLLLGTGLLGGFTTFSTFSVETLQLLRHDRAAQAAVYVAVSVLAAIPAAAAGVTVGRRLASSRAAECVEAS